LNKDFSDDRINLISENLVYSKEENPWVTLYFDVVKFPDGRTGNYNRIVERQDCPGIAILLVAQGRVCLVKQYRYPIKQSLWEIPRGFGESEDSISEAIRELCEETGIDPKLLNCSHIKLVEMGEVYPNSGLLTSKVRLFAIISAMPIPIRNQTDGEVAEVGWFPLEWVFSKIAESEITDSFTMAAILRMKLLKLL
jgi:ADP-ribose pyrophosphatase